MQVLKALPAVEKLAAVKVRKAAYSDGNWRTLMGIDGLWCAMELWRNTWWLIIGALVTFFHCQAPNGILTASITWSAFMPDHLDTWAYYGKKRDWCDWDIWNTNLLLSNNMEYNIQYCCTVQISWKWVTHVSSVHGSQDGYTNKSRPSSRNRRQEMGCMDGSPFALFLIWYWLSILLCCLLILFWCLFTFF